MDPVTRVSRRECFAFACKINEPPIIRNFFNDWVVELGDCDDHTNIEAIASWVAQQYDIFLFENKKKRVQLLRARFKKNMDGWLEHYLACGFEKVG